eukprot:GEMP01050034.1.p1 GENE.GEMP01050034.1~~GEMP01050034.1.p1  ORF type:complete len:305 (+),score=55.27 GEMP01050034.1:238-1152(+)
MRWSVLLSLAVAPTPPSRIPDESLETRACGEYKTLRHLLPAILYFVDVGSEYSERQLQSLADIASSSELPVVGVLSFSRLFEKRPCKSMAAYPGVTLLDDRADFDERPPSLNRALNMRADDMGIFMQDGTLFRYMPRHKSRLTHSRMYTWVQTMIEEFAALQADPLLASSTPLFLEEELDTYEGTGIFDLEPLKMEANMDLEECRDHCLYKISGCTGYSTWGLHECIFYIDEPVVLYGSKKTCSNANLFIRQVHSDVRATARIVQGLVWGLGIIFSAMAIYMVFIRLSRRRDRQGLSSLIQVKR